MGFAKRASAYCVLIVLGCISCRTQKTISYERAHSKDVIQIQFPLAAAVGNNNARIETQLVEQRIPANSDLLLLGSVDFGDDTTRSLLVAEIVDNHRKGRLIANSEIGTPGDCVQGVCQYSIGLKAPAGVGSFSIEVFTLTPKFLVARAEITVTAEEPR